jgi:hypothetical protein
VVTLHGSDKQINKFKEKMNQNFPEVEVIIPEIGKAIKVSLRK